MTRRVLACLFTVFLSLTALPVSAQSDTGEIDILVQDATSKAPVVLARVMLDGPVITSEFTGADGKVRFTEVPDGIYRARVFARGFQTVTSVNFEVTNGRLVTVDVNLALSQTTSLRTIASEVVKSTASVSTTSIDQNSAQRRLSDTLADALGKLSGVTVSTSSNDTDATQSVSLEGQDASQTALTLDGIPLNAPGTAGDLRGVGTDLFTRSSVSFGPQIGGLAGGVNFSTLEPTLSWQNEDSFSLGTNGKYNYSLGETGTLGKFGIAVMHTYRLTPSWLDGMSFLDASGLDYTHEGDSTSIGSMVKLRYQLDEAQTLTGMYLHSTLGSELVCAQITGPVPCGYGPGNSYDTAFDLYSLTDDALVGATQLQGSFYGMQMNSTHNLLNRYVDGEAEPTGTAQAMKTNGFTLNAILPARDRHTLSITAYDTNSTSAFTPLTASAEPYVFPGQSTSYGAITVNDSIRSNAKLRFNESVGLSHASNSGASMLLGLGTQWQANANDTYAFTYNLGGSAPHAGRFGVLSDPASLRYECDGDIAYGNAPGDQPGASSSTSARLSYTHRARAGLISTQIYRQVQNDIVVPAQVNGSVLVPTGIFPPTYFDQVGTVFNAQCGAQLQSAFPATNTYFSMPIGNVRRVYEGAQVSTYFQIGRLVLEPYYNIQAAKVLSADYRLNNPYSITIPGNQVPNVPLHRAGITLDYKAPGSIFEWLADANYTSSNNSQNLPAYATVDAGVNAHLTHGDLTFAATNVFNTYGGIFSSTEWAVPYTTLGGTLVPTIAHPNSPRQYSVTYAVRFGQGTAAQNSGRAPGGLAGQGEGGPEGPGGPVIFAGGPGGRRGPGGRETFRQLISALPETPPADPLAVDSSSPLCTPDAQKEAQPVLGGLKAYVSQIEAAKRNGVYPDTFAAPDIPGLAVTYHGLKTSYALTINLKQTAQLRTIFGCSSIHMADQQTAQQRNLYVEPSTGGGMFFRPAVTFMPSVGLYFVRRPPQPGTETFRVYKLPTTQPTAPFQLHSIGQTCTADVHATAQQALAQLQAHFSSGAATPAWTITPHTSSAGTWYSLEAVDLATVPALINCGHIAAAAKTDLTGLGWDGAPPPNLNYTPKLGLYMLMPQRRDLQGRPQGKPSPNP